MTLCTNQLTYKTVRDLRVQTFHKLSAVPLRYIDGHSHGDIISRVVTDIDLISDGLLQGFTQLFTGVVTILGTLLFMLTINVKIALVVVLITPLSLFVASFIARRSHKMFREQSAVRGEMTGYVEELIGNQKVVKAFSYEDRAQASFEEINRRLYDCGVKGPVLFLHDQSLHPVCKRGGVRGGGDYRRFDRHPGSPFGGAALLLSDLCKPVYQAV